MPTLLCQQSSEQNGDFPPNEYFNHSLLAANLTSKVQPANWGDIHFFQTKITSECSEDTIIVQFCYQTNADTSQKQSIFMLLFLEYYNIPIEARVHSREEVTAQPRYSTCTMAENGTIICCDKTEPIAIPLSQETLLIGASNVESERNRLLSFAANSFESSVAQFKAAGNDSSVGALLTLNDMQSERPLLLRYMLGKHNSNQIFCPVSLSLSRREYVKPHPASCL